MRLQLRRPRVRSFVYAPPEPSRAARVRYMSAFLPERLVTTKKPCQICHTWFEPNRHVGGRQRVCSRESCQQEAHRRGSEKWRQKNPGYDLERRIKARLLSNRAAEEEVPPLAVPEPPAVENVSSAAQVVAVKLEVDWSVAQDLARRIHQHYSRQQLEQLYTSVKAKVVYRLEARTQIYAPTLSVKGVGNRHTEASWAGCLGEHPRHLTRHSDVCALQRWQHLSEFLPELRGRFADSEPH